MRMESIKLSPKKGGNGYVSSYSVSIAQSEAKLCHLPRQHVIKIVDTEKQEIIIRAKHYTLTSEIIQTVCKLKRLHNQESNSNRKALFKDTLLISLEEYGKIQESQASGELPSDAERNLKQYLADLPLETLTDLTLVMYMGRQFDADLEKAPGEERYLEYFERYGSSVLGQEKEVLEEVLFGKIPLPSFLEAGERILFAPKGTDVNDLPRLSWSEYNADSCRI